MCICVYVMKGSRHGQVGRSKVYVSLFLCMGVCDGVGGARGGSKEGGKGGGVSPEAQTPSTRIRTPLTLTLEWSMCVNAAGIGIKIPGVKAVV